MGKKSKILCKKIIFLKESQNMVEKRFKYNVSKMNDDSKDYM